MSAKHCVTRVKVTAWVDQGIAPLVEALNAYPNLVTCESCERDTEGNAYVLFTAFEEAEIFAETIKLAGIISKSPENRAVLAVEWWYGSETPMIRLRCPPADVQPLADVLVSHAP